MRDLRRGARGCALLVVMLAASLAARPAAAFDDAALARQAYDGIILPGYARFDDAARAFVAKTEALCKSPSQAALDDTRAAARAALLAWGRIEPLRFGPMMQKQRFDRLLFYPDQHGIVAKQTAKLLAKRDDADIEAEKLAGASVAVQGFGAVDAVLYGHGSDTLASSTPEASFRCRYVHALAVDIAQIAAETHAEWAGDYKQEWLQPGAGNKTYLSPKETTQALYRAYATEIEVLRAQRLAPALKDAVNGAAPLLTAQRSRAAVHPRCRRWRARYPRARAVSEPPILRAPTRSARLSPSSAASPPTSASRCAPARRRWRWHPIPLPTTRRAPAWRRCCCP